MQLAGDSDIGPLALDREEEDYKEISHSGKVSVCV